MGEHGKRQEWKNQQRYEAGKQREKASAGKPRDGIGHVVKSRDGIRQRITHDSFGSARDDVSPNQAPNVLAWSG